VRAPQTIGPSVGISRRELNDLVRKARNVENQRRRSETCRVSWLDSRPGLFPASLAATIESKTIPDPAAFTTDPTDLVLVMTHSHGLDLAIVEARLRAMDFAWLGLIGSATKRRRFEGQLKASGIPAERLERLVCPIGLASIRGKEPAVIAASVTAQLLTVIEALRRGKALQNVA